MPSQFVKTLTVGIFSTWVVKIWNLPFSQFPRISNHKIAPNRVDSSRDINLEVFA